MRIWAPALLGALLVLTGCAGQSPATDAAPTAEPSFPPALPLTGLPAVPTPTPDPAFQAVDPTAFIVPGEEWAGPNFLAPSGNIGCAIGYDRKLAYAWGCRIQAHDWEFAGSPTADYIEVAGDGLPQPTHRPSPAFPAALPTYDRDNSVFGVRTLQYGQSLSWNDVTCYASFTNIRCENTTSGHGFVLSTSRNDIY